MISFPTLIQIVTRTVSSFSRWFKADHLEGIKHRIGMAIGISLIGILVDVVLTMCIIDYLPSQLPISFDWNGNVLEYGSKDLLWSYEIERFIVLVLSIIMGILIYRLPLTNRWAEKHYQTNAKVGLLRIGLLLVDMVMLAITVAMVYSFVMLGLSKENPSDGWSWIAFLFWTLVMLYEFYGDIKNIKLKE